MRDRAEQCRRRAKAVNDYEAADALRKMAEEIEADIQRLKSERDARRSDAAG